MGASSNQGLDLFPNPLTILGPLVAILDLVWGGVFKAL